MYAGYYPSFLYIWMSFNVLRIFSLLFCSEKNSISFIETSALDSTNVEEAFKNILTGRKVIKGIILQPAHC